LPERIGDALLSIGAAKNPSLITYATMRISEGISVFQLAANMGTSVEMIESFYGKKRMRDPRMATEETKFRGR
jgi:hypothetical protein